MLSSQQSIKEFSKSRENLNFGKDFFLEDSFLQTLMIFLWTELSFLVNDGSKIDSKRCLDTE